MIVIGADTHKHSHTVGAIDAMSGRVIADRTVTAYCGRRVGGIAARKRLMRPRADRKIAGVCAGVAEYFDLDVTLVRVVWLITAVMTGIGLLSYPIAWIIMPEEPAMVEVPAGYQAMNQ